MLEGEQEGMSQKIRARKEDPADLGLLDVLGTDLAFVKKKALSDDDYYFTKDFYFTSTAEHLSI